jgi:hypothetical protein
VFRPALAGCSGGDVVAVLVGRLRDLQSEFGVVKVVNAPLSAWVEAGHERFDDTDRTATDLNSASACRHPSDVQQHGRQLEERVLGANASTTRVMAGSPVEERQQASSLRAPASKECCRSGPE